MKYFQHQILHLIPANYVGLTPAELQVAVKKYSTIKLPEPVKLEDLEIVLHRYSKPVNHPSLTIFYFGKEVPGVSGQLLCASASEPLIEYHQIITASEELLTWWDSHSNKMPLEVTEIGFCKLDEPFDIQVSARAMERSDIQIGW